MPVRIRGDQWEGAAWLEFAGSELLAAARATGMLGLELGGLWGGAGGGYELLGCVEHAGMLSFELLWL